MTERSESERAELVALVDELASKLEQMPFANPDTLLRRVERALRSLTAQDQKPVAGPTCRCHDDVSREYWQMMYTDLLKRVDAGEFKPAPVAANASAELQNDLGEMLRALDMSDAAQPRSPHEVFQSAIAEMKRRLANASAEARLREALKEARLYVWLDSNVPKSKQTMLAFIDEALSAHPHASAEARLREALERIEYGIDIRMNDYLCEMKPDHDDSITGFNEAWDIVRKFLKDKIAALSTHPHASDCDKQGEAQAGHRCKRAGGFVDTSCTALCDCHVTMPLKRPSDRTADVTADELREWLYERRSMSSFDKAYALLDAFTVGRR